MPGAEAAPPRLLPLASGTLGHAGRERHHCAPVVHTLLNAVLAVVIDEALGDDYGLSGGPVGDGTRLESGH